MMGYGIFRRRIAQLFTSFTLAAMAMALSPVVVATPVAEARVTSSSATKCAAANRVQRAAAEFLRAGRSGSAAAMQRVLERHVAMRRVMNFALGKHRRKLTPAQRRRFHVQAKRYVARRLAAMSNGVSARRVKVVACRGRIVETVAEPGNMRILWKMRGGRIVDVNYRGMWMASLLRSQFDRMMRSAGGDVRTFLAQLK